MYLVMKKGGSDEGKFYAMKAVNVSATSDIISDWKLAIFNERKVLIRPIKMIVQTSYLIQVSFVIYSTDVRDVQWIAMGNWARLCIS